MKYGLTKDVVTYYAEQYCEQLRMLDFSDGKSYTHDDVVDLAVDYGYELMDEQECDLFVHDFPLSYVFDVLHDRHIEMYELDDVITLAQKFHIALGEKVLFNCIEFGDADDLLEDIKSEEDVDAIIKACEHFVANYRRKGGVK